MAQNHSTFLISDEYLEDLEELRPEQQGQIFVSLMRYHATGEKPEIKDQATRFLFRQMVRFIDSTDNSYRIRCAKNKYNALLRWAKEKHLSADELNEAVDQICRQYDVQPDAIGCDRIRSDANGCLYKSKSKHKSEYESKSEDEDQDPMPTEPERTQRTERTEPERNSFYDPEDPDLPFR